MDGTIWWLVVPGTAHTEYRSGHHQDGYSSSWNTMVVVSNISN